MDRLPQAGTHPSIAITLHRFTAPVMPYLIVSVLVLGLAACSNGPAPLCTDDSAACVAKRQQRYTNLTEDKVYSWTARPPDVLEYASGVRLFAYRSEQKKMSCEALRRGIAETASARIILTPEVTEGISADRISQIIALSDDVNAELTRTHASRC